MHSVYTYSSDYFPFYDDEYGHVHYNDDDDHASHKIQGSANLRTLLWPTSLTMMGSGECKPLGNLCSHVSVVCRKILHI